MTSDKDGNFTLKYELDEVNDQDIVEITAKNGGGKTTKEITIKQNPEVIKKKKPMPKQRLTQKLRLKLMKKLKLKPKLMLRQKKRRQLILKQKRMPQQEKKPRLTLKQKRMQQEKRLMKPQPEKPHFLGNIRMHLAKERTI
ncbi:hypothetical protein OBG91_01940 [Lactococcus lactis]|nr:hypothetical protein [Lactococcus lactis]